MPLGQPRLRVLYDISTLGLGQISVHARGGSYRVEQHVTEQLVASGACELLLCANHSSLAHEGCVEYLREHPRIGHLPLLRRRDAWIAARLRRAAVSTHRRVRRLLGARALPRLLRAGGSIIDARIHPSVTEADAPVDIYHSPMMPLPPGPRRGGSPRRFLTIYDLRGAVLRGSDAETAFEQTVLGSLLADDWVMTSSESTRNEICGRGVGRPGQIVVAPLAADRAIFHPCTDEGHAEFVRRRLGIPAGPYVLILNSPHPRKNIPHAVRAFARLVEQERVPDLSLVLCGDTPPGAGAVDGEPALRERIITTGYLADEDLAVLYGGAMAFVYPSLYEGFGLPPLEAMQCGTPVVTSNTSALPEVVGDAGVMVDPHDTDALCAALLALYRDGALRDSVGRACLARAAQFSWERTAACTLAAYRLALAA